MVRSRAKVLEAATELLVEGGAQALTVDAVSERSGVAKSTMYRQFPSRIDLLVEVLRHNVPPIDPDVPPGTFEESLRSRLHEMATKLSDPDWARIFPALISLKNVIPDIHALTEDDRAARCALMQAVLDRGVDEGLVPPGTDPESAVSFLIGPLVFAGLNYEAVDLHNLADQVVDHYVAACRARIAATSTDSGAGPNG